MLTDGSHIKVGYMICDRYRTAVEDVPKGEYTIPLGKANIKRKGGDITLVGWGQQVAVLEKAVRLVHVSEHLQQPPLLLTTANQWRAAWLKSDTTLAFESFALMKIEAFTTSCDVYVIAAMVLLRVLMSACTIHSTVFQQLTQYGSYMLKKCTVTGSICTGWRLKLAACQMVHCLVCCRQKCAKPATTSHARSLTCGLCCRGMSKLSVSCSAVLTYPSTHT